MLSHRKKSCDKRNVFIDFVTKIYVLILIPSFNSVAIVTFGRDPRALRVFLLTPVRLNWNQESFAGVFQPGYAIALDSAPFGSGASDLVNGCSMNLIGFVWLIYLTSSGWLGDLLPHSGTPMSKLGWQGNAAFHPFNVSFNTFAWLDSDCIWFRSAGCTGWNSARVVASNKDLKTLASEPQPIPSSTSASVSSAVVLAPLDKLYNQLIPWSQDDRSTALANRVTLVPAEVVPTSVQEESKLFHLCDVRDGKDRAIAYREQAPYQVWVNGKQVLALPSQQQAEALVRSLRELLQDNKLDPTGLYPGMVDGLPGLQVGNEVLFQVDDTLVQAFQRNADLIAMEWTNNLRDALGAPHLSLADAQSYLYGLRPSEENLGGIASWYGPYFHKRLTANGERFDQYEFTAAHKTLEFGTTLRVTNLANGRSVIVRINDRGPYVGERSLDLSYQAALCIDGDESGLVDYEAVILQPDERPAIADLQLDELKAKRAIAVRPTRLDESPASPLN